MLTLRSARLSSQILRVVLFSFCFPISLWVAGCGSNAGNQMVPNPTVDISANPTSVASSGASTLTVTASNATTVTVTGSDGSSYSLSSSGGTQSVTPSKTTTYTATATNETGASSSATATVTVTASAAPTVAISATPTSITAGTSSVLTVTATSATTVTITGTDGSTYTLQATGGTQSVSPTTTTTYTATATGAGGSATATATVTVSASSSTVPTVTISANPASVTSGGASVLTVTATNATTVTISGSDGSSYTLQPSGGTQSVTPTATTTYTTTATGAGGSATATATVTVSSSTATAPTVTITADPATIVQGNSATLTVTAGNATTVTVSGSDGSSYNLQSTGGTQSVSPAATTTYTATATGSGGTISATATVTVDAPGSINAIDHVIFMLQENRTFDTYFGMLNPYRQANGWTKGADGNSYYVDGIDDKLTNPKYINTNDNGQQYSLFKFTSSCIDDDSSAWLESYGDVSTYDFTADRQMLMDGFVHVAENYAESCNANGGCSGNFTDTNGQRAMGYYDQTFLNYYYYMASQFAVSDRWFSPVSSKTVDNRIATISGGTTQGLTMDPGIDDNHLPQLQVTTIYDELQQAGVSWKIYYTVNQADCLDEDDCPGASGTELMPSTDFTYFGSSNTYLYENTSGAACVAPTVASSAVGDSTNSFCIDTTHIAPISQFQSDLTNGTLPDYAFIEAGYGNNDEHPGSGQSILSGQQQVAKIVNEFMTSNYWKDSVFFLAYDEGGGPFDHVPPVPNHSNDNTDSTGPEAITNAPVLSNTNIDVNPDSYWPCLPNGTNPNCAANNCPPGQTTPSIHCDLVSGDPGVASADAAYQQGFAAQLGFRVPNIVISPFTRSHYVSHIPMDHTAIIKFVEDRFIGSSAHLTNRDAAQPDLLDFFDFTGVPWSTPPTPPTPVSTSSLGYDPCTPTSFAPQ